jgi:putative spermidine/putrescine transport system permease protein
MTPGRRVGAVTGLAWVALLYLTLPILVAVPLSLTDSRVLEFPRHAISFRHWIRLFTDPAWLGSIGQSLFIAIASTLIAVAAGTLCAIGCWRLASRVGDAIRLFMLLPIVIPSIIFAIGLYRLYAELRLLGTYTGVIVAHAVTGLPYVVITVAAALANMDSRLEQAARGLGASPGQVIRLVTVPSILPGMLSGAVFAFVHSWDELVVVLFIASREVTTLPRMIWNSINESLDPRIAAIAVVLIVTSILLLMTERAWSARRQRAAPLEP